jgi:replicative DNA helicase
MPAESSSLSSGARRLLPHNLEAEMSVVGGILLHPKAFQLVADLVDAQDFYHPTIAAIFESMVEVDRRSIPIDQISLAEQMKASGSYHKLRAVHGESYFGELMNAVVTVENIVHYARIVRSKATARRLTEAAQEIAARGYGDHGDVEEFIDEAERAVFEIAQRRQPSSYRPLKKLIASTINSIEERYNRKQVVTGVPTGFLRFDALTAGLQPGELIIVAARPSMGKTALVLNAAQNAAIEHHLPVLVFSLEMSAEALMERMLCSDGRLDSMRLRGGFIEARDWINITRSSGRLCEAPIFIDDSASPTLLDIRSRCRRWRSDSSIFKNDKQLGLVVIDYLQLVHGRPTPTRDQNREREIAEISRGLKALAKELRLPVVALSQLNRGVEARADKRPQLSDLRESGAIEQDADLIAFIYRDEVYNKESRDQGTAEIIIGKQRNGATGTVRLAFLNQYTRFENLASDWDSEA